MSIRTTESLVTFRRSFKLAGWDERLPAGTYRVVVDEQELGGVSFLAYQRVATMIHLPSVSAVAAERQVLDIDPDDLARALEADAA